MTGPSPLVSYRAPPDGILAQLLSEIDTAQPFVVGRQPLSVAVVHRVAHSGTSGPFAPRPVELTDDPAAIEAIEHSIGRLHKWLEENHVVYGVNTGYGGTGVFNKHLDAEHIADLQEVLIDGLLAGAHQDCLPSAVVRASMLVRVVSNFAGVSGLRLEVMQRIVRLLNEDVVPVVPLKGSLSASGDLVPLAYMVAALLPQHDPLVEVVAKGRRMPARKALDELGMEPLRLAPKEALAMVNGTSVGAAAGCSVAVQSLNAYFLAIALTAFANVAVRGTLQSYHPFIAEVKPHAGQIYSSRLIFNLLHSVSDDLVPKDDLVGFAPSVEHRLWQLTYPFRCATQHLAPEYDTILGAFHDLEIEINSVSDNPLILADGRRDFVISGGNFLGSTIARDMDKLKVSLHSIARLVHAQFKYLVKGVERTMVQTEGETIRERFLATHIIPLSAHPSDNMGFQGVEIYMDALLSEMNQKVGPHSSTYLSAEKDNQAIVAMALAAARTAADISSDLNYCLAAHLLATCQAFDLTTLDADTVRSQEASRVNVVIDNPRAGELGLLKPLYDYVRRECQIPVLTTATRMHTFLAPLVERIANLDLLAHLNENAIVPALAASNYDEHSSKG